MKLMLKQIWCSNPGAVAIQTHAATMAMVISTKMPAAVTRMRRVLSGNSHESLTLQYK